MMKRSFTHHSLSLKALALQYSEMRARLDALNEELERFHRRIKRTARMLKTKGKA